jgi:hypothetical protein
VTADKSLASVDKVRVMMPGLAIDLEWGHLLVYKTVNKRSNKKWIVAEILARYKMGQFQNVEVLLFNLDAIVFDPEKATWTTLLDKYRRMKFDVLGVWSATEERANLLVQAAHDAIDSSPLGAQLLRAP